MHNISYDKKDVFEHFGVPRFSGYKILNSQEVWRHYNQDEKDSWGRNTIVTLYYIREMEQVLEKKIKGRSYTWEQLGFEVGLECSGQTIQRATGTINYHKCIACRKGRVNDKTAKTRVEYATVIIEQYPKPKNWNE